MSQLDLNQVMRSRFLHMLKGIVGYFLESWIQIMDHHPTKCLT
jgi:hypothetical protein